MGRRRDWGSTPASALSKIFADAAAAVTVMSSHRLGSAWGPLGSSSIFPSEEWGKSSLFQRVPWKRGQEPPGTVLGMRWGRRVSAPPFPLPLAASTATLRAVHEVDVTCSAYREGDGPTETAQGQRADWGLAGFLTTFLTLSRQAWAWLAWPWPCCPRVLGLTLLPSLRRMVEYSLDLQNINLSAIRTVRVLRPLKAINRVPSELVPPALPQGTHSLSRD